MVAGLLPEMEVNAGHYAGVVVAVIVVWRFLNLMWFRPKKMEKLLRAQGLNGSSYTFMYGDLKEMAQMAIQARSKPIALKDDIVPRVLPFVHKSIATYGKICFTWMGRRPMVHITEPTMIREVLANHYQFRRLRGGNPLIKMLTKGLVDVEADQWVKHRKIINPAFHIEKLKHMVPMFYVSCNEMIKKWESLLIEESSCEVDVWPYLQTMSSDVISCTAFGSSSEEGKKIFELQHEMIGLIMKSARSTYIPGSMFLPTKRNKRMKEIDQKVKASIRSIIDRRVVAMKAGESNHDDLLGILLNSNYKETKKGTNKTSGLSIDEIIEECKLFYFTGQETTRDLLVWTMVLLGQYTDWQARARDEVLQVFGDKKPNFERLSDLKVVGFSSSSVNMIFNEVLRLFPPGPYLGRVVHKETKLGNIMLPAGTFLQMNIILLHHDRDIWGDDAKEFNPERFSEGVLKVTKGQACYLPFGGGPRICIGQNFAMLEAKMALVMILQRFCFEISPSYSHAPHVVITLQPQFGAQLILRRL
ncbi:cytochrome P450 [Cynara cardunculus var. scolymus]|uniref:Cytochrome P450 n=1 Tax=Cynara cardunculus var. scolymus TaxID=59895 RepID=A0A124SG48_CYNCS|nr:cytochrome P450 [Cynara cardunculus var. scolymus]